MIHSDKKYGKLFSGNTKNSLSPKLAIFYCIEISATNTEFSIRVTKESFNMANFELSDFFFPEKNVPYFFLSVYQQITHL